jgi:hypothetical protein
MDARETNADDLDEKDKSSHHHEESEERLRQTL